MARSLVVGNWKMNGSGETNRALVDFLVSGLDSIKADGTQGVEVAICPPFVYLSGLAERVAGSGLALGAQNLSHADSGAFTGEVSGHMLKDVGCQYVIVGHSERRHDYAETSELVASKYLQALKCGLQPILCVGETLEQRESGKTLDIIAEQIEAVVSLLNDQTSQMLIIAYEPVWAIGTGRTASPEQAQEVHAFIRNKIATLLGELAARKMKLLYGGSVKSSNAASLFQQADIDGGLVGGASLDGEEFLNICRAAL
ncbi:MAG: triose-phosphate isomerase [Pseudomonadales bacterium]|nr:triose-phosphate isomerase [Pseudomonadales bacterium]